MKAENAFVSLTLVLIFSIFVGFIIGYSISTADHKRKAVQSGFAEYDSQTGIWKWKDGKR
jgi:hypothetical protein